MQAYYLPYPRKYEIREVYAWDRPTAGCYPPHYHDHAEIMYIVEGKAVVELDYRQYTFCKGEAVLLFPNQIHRFLEPWGACRTYTYIFKVGVCSGYSQLLTTKRPVNPVIRNVSKIQDAVNLMELILKESAEQSPYTIPIVTGAVQALLGLLLKECPITGRGTLDETTAARILAYCHEHFTEPITLTSAAQALGLSPYYLSHLIPQKYGIRFNELILTLRLEESVRLIQKGEKVSSAALLAGFPSIRAFHRAFHDRHGKTPTVYLGLKEK